MTDWLAFFNGPKFVWPRYNILDRRPSPERTFQPLDPRKLMKRNSKVNQTQKKNTRIENFQTGITSFGRKSSAWDVRVRGGFVGSHRRARGRSPQYPKVIMLFFSHPEFHVTKFCFVCVVVERDVIRRKSSGTGNTSRADSAPKIAVESFIRVLCDRLTLSFFIQRVSRVEWVETVRAARIQERWYRGQTNLAH